MKEKEIYGLIGYPVKHSLSPIMHNAAFAALGLDAEYKLFEVKPDELKDFFAGLDKNNISGLNVTIPYKEKVLEFVKVDQESFYLRQIKAINTIVKKDGIWKGFNTDIPGFSRGLLENIDPRAKKTAVLGAGGAARAVVYALAGSHAREILIYDIDQAKAGNVVEMILSLFPGFNIKAVGTVQELDIKYKDILINATPIGMKKDDPCLIEENMLHKDLFVYDLIYNPAETALLKLAKKTGAKCSNGLRMLLYQAVLSFFHFKSREAPIKIMEEALIEGVKRT